MSYGIVNPQQSPKGPGRALYRFLRSIPTWGLWLLVVVWSIPTVGLLVNSVRTRDQQRATAVFEHRLLRGVGIQDRPNTHFLACYRRPLTGREEGSLRRSLGCRPGLGAASGDPLLPFDGLAEGPVGTGRVPADGLMWFGHQANGHSFGPRSRPGCHQEPPQRSGRQHHRAGRTGGPERGIVDQNRGGPEDPVQGRTDLFVLGVDPRPRSIPRRYPEELIGRVGPEELSAHRRA